MDLSLVLMDDILKELDKRFDTVLVLTNKFIGKNQQGDDVDDLHWHYKDKIGCLGLMRIADEGIKNSYNANVTDGFKDE